MKLFWPSVSQHPVDGGLGPRFPAAHWTQQCGCKESRSILRHAQNTGPACARARRSHAILRTFPRSIGNVFCEAETSLRQRQPTDFCVRQIRLLGHRNARRVQAAIFIGMHCCPPLRHHPPEMHYIHAMPSEEYAIGYRRSDFATFLTCVASICARCGRIVGSPPSTAHLYRRI